MDYLDKVHQVLGTPKQKVIEKFCTHAKIDNNFNFEVYEAQGLSKLLGHASQEFQDMVLWLLSYDPDIRPSAATVLKHPFFKPLQQQDNNMRMNQRIRPPQINLESEVPKLRIQELDLRTQSLSKAISDTPLLNTVNEQDQTNQNFEENKEESKEDNAYSLERSKINKERASSKLLRSIQNNCRRVSRRMVQRKLIPSTINLPKINTNSKTKRKSRQDIMQLSSNKINKQRHAKLLPTHQINEGSLQSPPMFPNENNTSAIEDGAINISSKIKSNKYLLLKDQRKSSKIEEIDNKFLPGIRVKSKSGKLDDPNTFLSTTAYNQKGKPLHQGVYDS